MRAQKPTLALLAVLMLLVGWADRRLSAAMVWRFPPTRLSFSGRAPPPVDSPPPGGGTDQLSASGRRAR